jgi:hypothetical protein
MATGRLFVDASGTVGIGATPISSYPLNIINNGNNFIQFAKTGDALVGSLIGRPSGTADLRLQNSENEPIVFLTNNTERLRITAAGLVGVGTSSPISPLDVNGQVRAGNLQITDGTYGLDITPRAYGVQLETRGTNQAIDIRSYGTTSASYITLATQNTERLRITSAGLVGIGTSSPATPLDVVGNIRAVTSATSATTVRIGNTGNNVFLGVESSTGGSNITGSTAYAGTITSNGPIQFSASNGGSVQATLDASGRLGIGATPSTVLDVNTSSGGSQLRISNGTYVGYFGIDPAYAGIDYASQSGGHRFRVGASFTEAARIDSSGRLLVGTSTARGNFFNGSSFAPQIQLEGVGNGGQMLSIISSENAYGPYLIFGRQNSGAVGGNTPVGSGDQLGNINFQGSDGTEFVEAATINAFVDGTPGANDMPGRLVFSTTADGASSPTERLRITSAGLVGIGTGSPGAALSVLSAPSNVLPVIQISSSGSLANNDIVRFQINGLTNGFRMFQDASSNVRYSFEGGSVGIGTTSPTARFDVRREDTDGKIAEFHQSGGYGIDIGSSESVAYISSGYAQALTFKTDPSSGQVERARIDSSGRLLVGTSTSRNVGLSASYPSTLQLETTNYAAASFVNNSNDVQPAYLTLGKSRGGIGSNTVVQSGDVIGLIGFAGADGTDIETLAAHIQCTVDGTPGANDMPGRLVFSTTADGASSPTERMRITSGIDLVGISSPDGSHSLIVYSGTSAGTGLALFIGKYGSSAPYTGGTNSIIIWTNGNVVNTNNSYGALSDIKLKENVVDANSQWDDLKALQVRNYNFKEGQTHTQIGLVAQEVELVSPGLVSESPDRDEDGNDLGTVTKSVNYSVLYMKAVKALQEAMERIETLEARLTAAGIE